MSVKSPNKKKKLIWTFMLIQLIEASKNLLCYYAFKEQDKLVHQNKCIYLENINFIWKSSVKTIFLKWTKSTYERTQMYMYTAMHFLHRDVCLLTNYTHYCLISYSYTCVKPLELPAICRRKVPRNVDILQQCSNKSLCTLFIYSRTESVNITFIVRLQS